MAFSEYRKKRILVMGLGLHGGGAAAARFFAEAGAHVAVTDLRSTDDLAASIEGLSDLDIRYVLGEHRERDFEQADVVIKNPAVPRNSRFLRLAKRVETDISLFLHHCDGPVIGITGTKGKSTTSSMVSHLLKEAGKSVRLGGNITVSPLSFLADISAEVVTVLELSSFQLGDLHMARHYRAGTCKTLDAVAITNLMPDHQDYYPSMAAYADDKAIIFERQTPDTAVVLSDEDDYSRKYQPPYPEQTIRIGRANDGELRAAAGDQLLVRLSDIFAGDSQPSGNHTHRNALFAAVLANRFGIQIREIADALTSFPGVPHRLERIGEAGGVRFINDSAATIQEATLAAVQSFQEPVHLIAGGSDKGVPLDLFVPIARCVKSLHLLAGSATARIIGLLDESNLGYDGPFETLQDALSAARTAANSGESVLLSPGCASFGMFRNEFDRGDQFRELVHQLIKR